MFSVRFLLSAHQDGIWTLAFLVGFEFVIKKLSEIINHEDNYGLYFWVLCKKQYIPVPPTEMHSVKNMSQSWVSFVGGGFFHLPHLSHLLGPILAGSLRWKRICLIWSYSKWGLWFLGHTQPHFYSSFYRELKTLVSLEIPYK